MALPDNVGLIHGGTTWFRGAEDMKTIFSFGKSCPEKYMGSMGFSQPSAFIRKKYLDKVGYLDQSLHYGMDYDLFSRLSLVSRFQPVKEVFSKYRIHADSKSVAQSEKFRKDWDRVFLSLCVFLGWNDVLEEVYFFLPELKSTQNLLSYHFDKTESIIEQVDKRKALFCFFFWITVYNLPVFFQDKF